LKWVSMKSVLRASRTSQVEII